MSSVGASAADKSNGSVRDDARWGTKSPGKISGVSNPNCGCARSPNGGAQLVRGENRFGSTAEADRLVGCQSAKAAVQQSPITKRISVRALYIFAELEGRTQRSRLDRKTTSKMRPQRRIPPEFR